MVAKLTLFKGVAGKEELAVGLKSPQSGIFDLEPGMTLEAVVKAKKVVIVVSYGSEERVLLFDVASVQTAPCTRCREEMVRNVAVDGNGIDPRSPNKAFGLVEVGDWRLCDKHGSMLNASRRKQEQRAREKEQRATWKGEVCCVSDVSCSSVAHIFCSQYCLCGAYC